MRHRFTVALYDEYPVEAEILDYLVPYGRGKRQEVLRMLVKAGYASMMQHKDASSAMMNAVDPDALALLVQALSGAQAPPQAAHQNVPQSMSSEPKQAPKSPTSPAANPQSKVPLNQPKEDSVPSDDQELSEFEPEDEAGILEMDDDDIEDPMAKFMSLE
jgi:hypothetical protein